VAVLNCSKTLDRSQQTSQDAMLSQTLVISSHTSQCALNLILQLVISSQPARIVMVIIVANISSQMPLHKTFHSLVFRSFYRKSLLCRGQCVMVSSGMCLNEIDVI
jgi:hypothetical protein